MALRDVGFLGDPDSRRRFIVKPKRLAPQAKYRDRDLEPFNEHVAMFVGMVELNLIENFSKCRLTAEPIMHSSDRH